MLVGNRAVVAGLGSRLVNYCVAAIVVRNQGSVVLLLEEARPEAERT